MKLNTRSKILPVSRVDEFADAIFVAMHIDPLTVDHARRLAGLSAQGRRVVVLLSDPPSPLLPLAARAELAAALESVSAVMVVDGAVNAPVVIGEESADLDRRESLVQLVLRRHAAAVA